MPTKNEFYKLAETRLNEAKLLFTNGYYDGCYYLAGYVIEYALKARICRILDLNNYDDFSGKFKEAYHTHDLEDLLIAARLKKYHDDLISKNTNFKNNWDTLIYNWSEQIRYAPIGKHTKSEAQGILEAIDSKPDGIFTWIKKYW